MAGYSPLSLNTWEEGGGYEGGGGEEGGGGDETGGGGDIRYKGREEEGCREREQEGRGCMGGREGIEIGKSRVSGMI